MFRILHGIRRGNWVDHVIVVAQVLVAIVAALGLVGWLTLNPFLLLTFIFAQPLVVMGLILFICAAVFFERAIVTEIFDAGETIYRQGEHARSIYLVKSGTVDATYRRKDGMERTVATFKHGQYFSFAALMPELVHRFSARARTEAEIIRIRPADFLTLFSEIPETKAQIPALRHQIDEAIRNFADEMETSG